MHKVSHKLEEDFSPDMTDLKYPAKLSLAAVGLWSEFLKPSLWHKVTEASNSEASVSEQVEIINCSVILCIVMAIWNSFVAV